MTIATTEPGTLPLAGGRGRDADVDLDAEFAELICADPDLVDIEFAAIVAELGQPSAPSERLPVPSPRPAPRTWPRRRSANPPVPRAERNAVDGWRRERSPPAGRDRIARGSHGIAPERGRRRDPRGARRRRG